MQIINTLGDLRRGRFLEDLDAELRALVDAIRDASESGRAARGEITIKLVLKSHADDEMALDVLDTIAVKMPKRPEGRSIFFATGDGGLARQDPRQNELPLRDVSAKAG